MIHFFNYKVHFLFICYIIYNRGHSGTYMVAVRCRGEGGGGGLVMRFLLQTYVPANHSLKQCHSAVTANLNSQDVHPMLAQCWPMLAQCWATVADGGPALSQHWIIFSCLLGADQQGVTTPSFYSHSVSTPHSWHLKHSPRVSLDDPSQLK